MVTSGTDQAVWQHGISQMSSSEAITPVPIAEGHVLIPAMFPQLNTAPAVNATHMPPNWSRTSVL